MIRHKALIGAVLTIIGVIAGYLDIGITDTQMDSIGAGLLAVIGIYMATTGEPPKKGAGTAILAMILLPAAIVSTAMTQTGCQSLREIADAPAGQIVIRTAIRTASYYIAANNPDYAPAIRRAAAAITLEQLKPANFAANVRESLDDADLDPAFRVLFGPIEDELLRVYSEAYAAYQDSPNRDQELERLVDTLTKAIKDGAFLATSGTEASGPTVNVGFSEVTLRIE